MYIYIYYNLHICSWNHHPVVQLGPNSGFKVHDNLKPAFSGESMIIWWPHISATSPTWGQASHRTSCSNLEKVGVKNCPRQAIPMALLTFWLSCVSGPVLFWNRQPCFWGTGTPEPEQGFLLLKSSKARLTVSEKVLWFGKSVSYLLLKS